MHFQVVLSLWELEVMTDLLCVYCWKIFEQIVIVAYLKKQQPEMICKKRALKNFVNFTGLRACNVLQKRLWHRCIAVKFTKFLRAPILKSICEPLHTSVSSEVIFFTMHEKVVMEIYELDFLRKQLTFFSP